MIDAIISGHVAGPPEERVGRNGNPYVLVKLWVPSHGKSLFVSVIAFDYRVADEILLLKRGDAVSIAGPIKVATWQDREGNYHPSIDMEAIRIMSILHVPQSAQIYPSH